MQFYEDAHGNVVIIGIPKRHLLSLVYGLVEYENSLTKHLSDPDFDTLEDKAFLHRTLGEVLETRFDLIDGGINDVIGHEFTLDGD